MTSFEGLLAELRSASSIDRLKAARQLALVTLTARERLEVRQVRSRESDAWVRSALDLVLGSGDGVESSRAVQGEPVASSLELQDVRAQAIADVTQTILHEMNPMIGRLREKAAAEVPSYPESQTNVVVERLGSFLETVARLERAARPPEPIEFDLTDAVARAVASVDAEGSGIRLGRSDPVQSWGDWDLIELALVNALKNAIEACEGGTLDVVVTWGTTDIDSWIVVLDGGCGLPDGFESAFEAGTSTKRRSSNHGWGLAIALRAITSAGGTIKIFPRSPRGAACEMRWPLRPGDEQ